MAERKFSKFKFCRTDDKVGDGNRRAASQWSQEGRALVAHGTNPRRPGGWRREKEREGQLPFHRQVTLWARSPSTPFLETGGVVASLSGVRCRVRRRLSITHTGAEMEDDAAAGAVSPSQAIQGEVTGPTSAGSGRGKTVRKVKESGSSGVILGQLALAPMDGHLVYPQQQQLSEDEEEGGGAFLCSSARSGERSDAGTAAVTSAPKDDTTFEQHLRPNDLFLVAPPSTASSSCSRRWILCGRTVMAMLKFVWSTATVTMTLIAALLATLVFFWALSPVCTTCVRSSKRSNSAAAAIIESGMESGRSSLYINQLQVSHGCVGYRL